MPILRANPPTVIMWRATNAGQGFVGASALSEWVSTSTSSRIRLDMSRYRMARIGVQLNATFSANMIMAVQYSANLVTPSWSYFDGNDGPKVSLFGTGAVMGNWAALAIAARAEVIMRIIFRSGDDATTGTVANIFMELK